MLVFIDETVTRGGIWQEVVWLDNNRKDPEIYYCGQKPMFFLPLDLLSSAAVTYMPPLPRERFVGKYHNIFRDFLRRLSIGLSIT
jgi:hypothetical protein